MLANTLLCLLAITAKVTSQFVTYQGNDFSLAVNVPASTTNTATSTNSDPLYLQISAPSDIQWLGFGQGSGMSGANMFIIYTDGNNNITLSPRLGAGHIEPKLSSATRATLLEGSGIQPDGSLIANIRCDTCFSWDGGKETMSPDDTSSHWIWAFKKAPSLESPDPAASLQFHDASGFATLDLTQGRGGDSSNPFLEASSSSSNSPNDPGVSTPITDPNSSSSSTSPSTNNNTTTLLRSHATLMSLTFLLLFPLGALTIYLSHTHRILSIHAPLQLLGLILSIIGASLGIILARRLEKASHAHPVIGYIVMGYLVIFQPAMGLYQHLQYRKTGACSKLGVAHRWLGRMAIFLGAINGILGFREVGFGMPDAPRGAYVAYSAILGSVVVGYVGDLVFVLLRRRRGSMK